MMRTGWVILFFVLPPDFLEVVDLFDFVDFLVSCFFDELDFCDFDFSDFLAPDFFDFWGFSGVIFP